MKSEQSKWILAKFSLIGFVFISIVAYLRYHFVHFLLNVLFPSNGLC